MLLAGSGPSLQQAASHAASIHPSMSQVFICIIYQMLIYAGNALSTVRYTGVDPCLLTIRSTSFPLPHISPDSKSEAAPVSQVDLSTFREDILDKSRFLKLTSQDTERPDLGSARVVVTGGRGLRSAENFKLMEKLAEKLSAAVGATQAAVDAGLVPNELQVANYVLVADLFDVIPELLEKLPEKK
ncbi:Electron transfer flavoprotein subunit alpha protein [Thalictrum thalictroides]|uniref:Electron transfer flavoprotein subunit alpha protein n=1 Tax=Thalictrum thalictroides TaxID=46969 RepID=A0A7J6VET9_THATH|nr:Electron transfer flavoprotein subunit alpha protein [Thalictrum thalictroides]